MHHRNETKPRGTKKMKKIATNAARKTVPALVLASLFLAPVGALAFNNNDGPVLDKQGAGLVLYVSLQRNAMGG